MAQVQTIPQRLQAQITSAGQNPAYRFRKEGEWREITWAEVGEKVSSLGSGLIEIGLELGDKVGLIAENRLEWCLSYLAVVCAGGVVSPIHLGLPTSQIIHIANKLDLKILILSKEDQLKKILDVSRYLPKIEKIVIMDEIKGQWPENVITYSDVIKRASSPYDKTEFNKRQESITLGSLADIGCTSGTQGQPKGVMLTHGNLMSNANDSSEVLGIKPPFTFLSFLPFSYIFERGIMLSALNTGVTIAFAESLETFERDLCEVKPDAVALVPRFLEKIFNQIKIQVAKKSYPSRVLFNTGLKIGLRKTKQMMETGKSTFYLDTLEKLTGDICFQFARNAFGGRCKYLICGGAKLLQEVEEFFCGMGFIVITGYGLAEASPVISVNRPKEFKFGTVGKPIKNVKIKICPDGEILFKGPNMTQGYYADTEATENAIDKEGWFQTGDIGSLDEEGFLRIIDRKDDIIILSTGDNVSPQNIEGLLLADEYIDQALIIGDSRNYINALIVPSFNSLRKWAEEQDIENKDDLGLISDARVIRFMDERMKNINDELPYFEQIKKFALMERDFRIELGEMTCTHKLRRKIIEEKYGDLIRNMYKEKAL